MNKRRPSLKQLIPHYSPDVIQRALILHWAAVNGVTDAWLNRSAHVAPLLLSAPDAPIPPELTLALQANFPHCSLKQVEQVFETLIGTQKRQSHGTVYTPDYIIDYLLTHALRFGWQASSHPPRICDPACGAGGFLVRAAEILHQQHQLPFEQIFNDYLVGMDVDPWAIDTAHILLDLYLLHKGVRPDRVTVNLLRADALLTPLPDLLARANAPTGFDIVVTNPPYVKLQNLEVSYREALLREYADFARGSFSLALLFLVRCHALLAPQGCAALITQNNLFTSLAGRGVREYLQQQRCVRQIVDFGHHKVFANASAYTCLLFLGNEPHDTLTYGALAGALGDAEPVNVEPVNAKVLDELPLSEIKLDSLDARKWRLAKPNHLDNLQRIEATGRPLGQLAAIRVGFATLKDAIFLLDDTCRGTQGEDEYRVERAITKPAWRVPDFVAGSHSERSKESPAASVRSRDSSSQTPRHDIFELGYRAAAKASAYRVIFPYHKVNGKYRLIPEVELSREYPRAYHYLVAHRDALLTRDKRRKQYAAWYAWGRTQGMEAAGPKLLTKTFSQHPDFVLDETDHLYCNGYGIFPKQVADATLPLEGLARILNSKIMHYYAKLTSFQLEGNYQCYQKNFIERFGIPTFTDAAIATVMALSDGELNAYLAQVYGVAQAEIDEVVGADAG